VAGGIHVWFVSAHDNNNKNNNNNNIMAVDSEIFKIFNCYS